MTTVSAYDEILQLKTEGNNCFVKRQYEVAIKYYATALEHSVYSTNDWTRHQQLTELRQSLLLNRAKSHYKLENLKDALIDSAHCIQCNQNSKLSYKAHFTRAEIYHYVNNYKTAIRHCDIIIAAPSELGLSALQSRTKKLRKQIEEKSIQMERSTVGGHRSEVERIQHDENSNANSEVAILVSAKWWRKWYAIPAETKLTDVDVSVLTINNSDLQLIANNNNNNNNDDEVKESTSQLSSMSLANGAGTSSVIVDDNKEDVIEIASVYLDHSLAPNLKVGRANDFVLVNFAAYNRMIKLGYKLTPILYVKNKEIYKTKFTVYFGDHRVSLLCSMHETIGKISREIARHFVITSSSMRLRYKSKYGVILDASHTLLQHELSNKYAIYVEVRLPNGCWPIHDAVAQYDHKQKKNTSNNATQVVCGACHRLISHFVKCPKREQCATDTNYCNGAHIRAHFHYHFELEHKRQFRKPPRLGLTALQNLGNTCYMNSSVQCLSFIPELRSYLIADDYLSDINKDNPLGYKGELARVFSVFLKQMWFGISSVISPREFRLATAQLYQQWDTTQQQDAEEFLRWLLDGLHEDLNLIHKKPYYELDDSNGRNDHVVADEHWQLHLRRNQSVIVDLFQGQYKSALTCPQCDHKSVKFDAFSALTLPIPDRDTMIPVHCLVFTSNLSQAPYKLTVNVSARAVVTQLTDVLSEKLGTHLTAHRDDDDNDDDNDAEIKEDNDNDNDEQEQQQVGRKKEYQLLICKVNNNKFGKYWSSGRPIRKVLGKNQSSSHLSHHKHSSGSSSRVAYTYIYQVLSTTIAQRKTDHLVQCRMNFRYQPRRNLSDSSGGSDDDAQNETTAASKCTYFAHPIVFDVDKSLFTGNNVYEHFKRRFETFARKQVQPPMPSVQMFLERVKDDSNDEIEIVFDDKPLLLSNDARNLATINVEFSSEYEYSKYVDQSQAITDVDFNQLSDEKPKNFTDLYDCLKLYTAAEVLDEANWKCSSCKRQCEPSKQISLWRLPEILIVHLKRFVNVQGIFGGVGRKNNLEIKTPINGLNLKPYLADTTNIGEIPKYDLFATVNHNGIMDFGHYYSCVRTDDSTRITNFYDHYNEVATPEWHVFNDEHCKMISGKDVDFYIKDAYLLFYRRRNSV